MSGVGENSGNFNYIGFIKYKIIDLNNPYK